MNSVVPDRAHFLLNLSFIKFQTVEFEQASSSTFTPVFRVLARGIGIFQVFLSSSLAEFKFWRLKLVEYLSFKWLNLALESKTDLQKSQNGLSES